MSQATGCTPIGERPRGYFSPKIGLGSMVLYGIREKHTAEVVLVVAPGIGVTILHSADFLSFYRVSVKGD